MLNIIVPTIHLNGTSAEELIDQLSCAWLALDDAIKAMRGAAPHGRDYYVQANDGMTIAQAQFEDRERRVAGVMAEIAEIRGRIENAEILRCMK